MGLGIGNKRVQHNIVDLFSGTPTDPDRRSLHGEWTYTHTHTHTQSKQQIARYKCAKCYKEILNGNLHFLFSVQKQSLGGVLQKKYSKKIPQKSQENTSVVVFFLINLHASGLQFFMRIRHSCFPVNFARFLRTAIL